MRLLANLKETVQTSSICFQKEFITNPNSLDFSIHCSLVIAIYTLCIFHLPHSATKVCSWHHNKQIEEFGKSTTCQVFVQCEFLAPDMIRDSGARSWWETCFCYKEKFTASHLK